MKFACFLRRGDKYRHALIICLLNELQHLCLGLVRLSQHCCRSLVQDLGL